MTLVLVATLATRALADTDDGTPSDGTFRFDPPAGPAPYMSTAPPAGPPPLETLGPTTATLGVGALVLAVILGRFPGLGLALRQMPGLFPTSTPGGRGT
jgi:hypothetical protein